MDNGYGITSSGFNKKTFNDLLEELEAKLKSQDLFGPEIDFTDADPLKQFSIPIIELLSEIWELGEQVFYSASPKYAEGVLLRNTGKYIGILGKQPSKSKSIAKFTGEPGTLIPLGFKIKTETDIVFKTLESKIIPSNGSADINIESEEVGLKTNVAINTINKIVTPIIGLNSVTNTTAANGGQDEETDIEFRNRYDESTQLTSGGTIEAIKAFLLKVTGVSDVSILENPTDTTVSGIPPHAFQIFVRGGLDDDIAKAIFSKKSGGITAFGSTVVDVIDSQGNVHKIGFSRPTEVNIWYKININKNSDFPSDGNELIKNAIFNFGNNLKQGEDVLIYKIITAISNLKLAGVEDISIQISKDNITFNASNIAIDGMSYAATSLDKIEVI